MVRILDFNQVDILFTKEEICIMSKKSKWKESFQKARSISQTSLGSSNSFVMDLPRTSSVMNEETTDQELNDYIRAIKQKSGLKNLWSGDKFLKAVRDEEEKTPDISISREEGIDEGKFKTLY